MIQPYLPLCKLCYLQSMAGKVAVLALRDGLGNAIFNTMTKKLEFPVSVPKARFPQKGLKKGRKGLMASINGKFVVTHSRAGIVGISDMCLTGAFPVPTNQDPEFAVATFPSRFQDESEILSSNGKLNNGNHGCSVRDSKSIDQSDPHVQVSWFVVSWAFPDVTVCRFRSWAIAMFGRYHFCSHAALSSRNHWYSRGSSNIWLWHSPFLVRRWVWQSRNTPGQQLSLRTLPI
jgi:hypothetical protein